LTYLLTKSYDVIGVHSCGKSARLSGHSCCFRHQSALQNVLMVGLAML